ncbi:hypothetical protein ECGR_4885 [Escherichia coli]|nr:hypothetical protein ECGR_4885 [Escherichia coli]
MLRFLIFAMLLFVNLEAKIPKDTLIIAVENEIARINPAYSEDHDAPTAHREAETAKAHRG